MDTLKFNILLQSIKHSKKAFEELYRYYFPRIKVDIGRRYKDEGLGEDIAQDFFLKLYKIKPMEWIKHPTTWVMKVCDNLAKDSLRRMPRSVPLVDEICAASDDENYNDLKNGGISEENIAFLKSVDKVTLNILVMHYWEGYTLKEIAKILEMNYDTVKRRHSRVLKKLKNLVRSGPFFILIISLLG